MSELRLRLLEALKAEKNPEYALKMLDRFDEVFRHGIYHKKLNQIIGLCERGFFGMAQTQFKNLVKDLEKTKAKKGRIFNQKDRRTFL